MEDSGSNFYSPSSIFYPPSSIFLAASNHTHRTTNVASS
jgi:hypothetical protein